MTDERCENRVLQHLQYAHDTGHLDVALRIFEEETGITKPMYHEVDMQDYQRILPRLQKEIPMGVLDRLTYHGFPAWVLPGVFAIVVMVLFFSYCLDWR